MTLPDFFVLGAPKCGTTSLARMLSSHPNILMSNPKEPFYYCSDIRHPRRIADADEYRALFRSERPENLRRGEASTLYLYSEVAVPKIEEDVPGARYIVMLREPVDLLLSWHNHMLRSGYVEQEDVAAILSMESGHRFGTSLCPDEKFLDYFAICSLGSQVQRLLERVPADRVLFLWLNELKDRRDEVLAKVTKFLDLPQLALPPIGPQNSAYRPRNLALFRLNRRVVAAKKRWASWLPSIGLLGFLGGRNRQPGYFSVIHDTLRNELALRLESEMRLLSCFTQSPRQSEPGRSLQGDAVESRHYVRERP